MRVEHKPFRKPLKAIGRAQEGGVSGEEVWLKAYMALPYDIRGLWLSAWQSEQWNSLLSDHLHELFDSHLLYPVKIGVGGPLYFPTAPAGKQGRAKRTLVEQIGKTLEGLPETIQMPHSDLDLSQIDQYLSDHARPTMVHSEIEASEAVRDEMNGSAKRKRWKASLGFDLSPGAYATVLVKRLFH
jgi:tRNA(Glu) U13 pseudouridine synthase TruD